MTKINTPTLRFKEFDDEWDKGFLGSFTNIQTGKLDANEMSENGKYDFYTSGIKKFKIDVAAFYGPAITIAGNGATVGYMHLADNQFNAYQRTYVLTDFKIDRLFLYQEIGQRLPIKISQEARTGNIPYIVLSMLTDLKINFPRNSAEQSAIGSLFQTLDELLSAYKDNVANYQAFKASMLSKMFPKEGQTTPEIRLDGFDDEWNWELLGKVVKRIKSYSLSRDVETLEQTGLKYIHYGDIHTGKADFINKDNELPYIKPDEKYTSLLEKGDLLFADASEDYKGIAAVAVIREEPRDNIIGGLHTIAVRPNKQLDPIFLYYQFKTQVFRKHGYKVGTGMKVFGISSDNLFKYQLAFPDKIEQRAIGAFFSNLDDLLSNYQDKITQLETLKKKLLQEMFI